MTLRRLTACGVVLAMAAGSAFGGGAAAYPREGICDMSVHQDEALVNVGVRFSQWPDCTALRSAMADIFRIEGVSDKDDQAKAFAFWKWFRILVSATGGSYAHEGPRGHARLVTDPHKIFTVYGHHQCDGLSWAMASLWRAADYMALDECTHGHTTAALRYRDADGRLRYHSFDPQGRFYYWDDVNHRVGVRSIPVMTRMVYRHVMQPQEVHSLRTSLRPGETVERTWSNAGHIVPHGRGRFRDIEKTEYYRLPPPRLGKKTVYASVGTEVQTYEVETAPDRFRQCLYDGSENVACSPLSGVARPASPGRAALHPKEPGEVASFIYRLAPPYVAVDGTIKATLVKGHADDLCRLSIARDGGPWRVIFDKKTVGLETVTIDVGRRARDKDEPDIYTAYSVLVKAEFRAAADVQRTGMNALRMTVRRQLNMRTLPNLRPGENVVKVTADRLAPDRALKLTIRYRTIKPSSNGQAAKPPLKDVQHLPPADAQFDMHEVTRVIRTFPYYFPIRVPGVRTMIPKYSDYDRLFNVGELRMDSIRMRLASDDASRVPRPASPGRGTPAQGAGRSMDPRVAEPFFERACPHPANMTHRAHQKIIKDRRRETDIIQTNGFLPQRRVRLDADDTMDRLIKQMNTPSAYGQWVAAQQLGDYPAAVDALCEALPRANIDLTLFIVKALAQIGDRKAIPALLKKWNRQAPRGAPGTRYIPDALAAIGDRAVVPHLLRKLPACRFDLRFHIAHALGILGGPEAEAALKDMAANDPFPPVREEAAAGLKRLEGKAAGG